MLFIKKLVNRIILSHFVIKFIIIFYNYKYTFSSSSAQCQTISNINIGYGHLMISNNQFFVLGIASTSPSNLQMYKIAFLSTSVDWANQIICAAGWSIFYSESVLSSDRSTVYMFFSYGPSSRYLYFAGLSISDGSVTTARYKSSATVVQVWGSTLNADYVVNLKFNNSNLFGSFVYKSEILYS